MKKYFINKSINFCQSLVICGCISLISLPELICGLPASPSTSISVEQLTDPLYMNSQNSGQMNVDYPNYIVEETKHESAKRNQLLHRYMENLSSLESCCPSVPEVIEPLAGKNRAGDLVELYQTERRKQRFYEISCAEDVVDLPCKYLDNTHKKMSRCIQQYSYSYALVRDIGAKDQSWRLDYILTRSGCSCHISPSN